VRSARLGWTARTPSSGAVSVRRRKYWADLSRG
jgi:hypothetical protein